LQHLIAQLLQNPVFYSKGFLENLLTAQNRQPMPHLISYLRHVWNLTDPMKESIKPLERIIDKLRPDVSDSQWADTKRGLLIKLLENRGELYIKGKALERAHDIPITPHLASVAKDVVNRLPTHLLQPTLDMYEKGTDFDCHAKDLQGVRALSDYVRKHFVRDSESFSAITRNRLMYRLLSAVPLPQKDARTAATQLLAKGLTPLIKQQFDKALNCTKPDAYKAVTEYYYRDTGEPSPKVDALEIWALGRLVRRHFFPATPTVMVPSDKRVYKQLMALILESASPVTVGVDLGKHDSAVYGRKEPDGTLHLDIETFEPMSDWRKFETVWGANDTVTGRINVNRNAMQQHILDMLNSHCPRRMMLQGPRRAGKTSFQEAIQRIQTADLAALETRLVGMHPALAAGYAVHDSFNNLLKEKFTMKITTQTLVNGVNIKDISQDKLFDLIAGAEAEIKRLKAITARPASLTAKITELQASIDQLVALMDAA